MLSAQTPNPLDKLGLPAHSTEVSPAISDAALVLLIALGIAACIALWMFLRHRKQNDTISTTRLTNATDERSNSFMKRRKRRRKVRRNPTLAETGGLPPMRDEADNET